MNNIVIRNIEPQEIKIGGGGEVIGITKVYVNGEDVTIGSSAYVIVPTKTSELINDSGYITNESDPTVPSYVKAISLADIQNWDNKQQALVSGTNIKTINGNSILGSGNLNVSTSYSAGTGIEITEENVINNTITSYDDLTDLPTIPTKTSDLLNDSDYVTSSELSEVAFNGSYLALSDTPDSTSDFTNDGEDGVHPYITNETDSLVNYYDKDFIYNLLPKVSDEGSNISLSPSYSSKLEMELKATTLNQTTTTGANLQKFNTRTTSYSGMDYVCDDIGQVTITGNAGGYIVLGYNLLANAMTLTAGTYKVKVIGTISSNTSILLNGNLGITLDSNQEYTYVLGSDTTTFYIAIGISIGTHNDNFYITLSSGTTATTERYTGGIASPNPQYPQDIHTISGSNTIVVSDGNDTSQEADIDLDTIEYCKIGTYEDKFIRSNDGTWQLEKNIGKVQIKDLTIYTYTSATYGFYFYMKPPVMVNNASMFYCRIYKKVAVSPSTWVDGTMTVDGDNIQIIDNRYSTANDFKTGVGDEYIYYPLSIPTYTPITGTLAEQLENIYYNLTSYNEQTNISQVNTDLPFTISASTLKDISSL